LIPSDKRTPFPRELIPKTEYEQMTEDFITKIEGHGRLSADWKKNKVVLEIHEGERLFEGIVVGRPAIEAPWITARICGVCPIAHNLCAFRAVEDALGVRPDKTTILLRRLLTDGQMIQSHALHLYFLALPDYLGIDSGLELKAKHPKYFKAALTLKEISDEIAKIVGGRSTHPTTTTIGGFHKTPSDSELKQLNRRLRKEALPAAISTARLAIELFYPKFEIDLNLLSQIDGGIFNVYESEKSQGEDGKSWPIKKYKERISEEIRDHSTAKLGFYRAQGGQGKGEPAMVGALARIAVQKEKLNSRAKRLLARSRINYRNPFHNNLAQAIEIVHFVEEAIKLTEEIALNPGGLVAKPRGFKNPKGKKVGIGAVEAPRGGLYHEYTIDEKGMIADGNIITPTVQNLGSLEMTAQALADQTKGEEDKKREKLIEMLIRAYDPCITCSVH
jgi:sulfhydrogenase subunit alpha